jgi:uncharacterized membrane protein SirB2
VSYLVVKYVHVGAVFVSFVLFLVRGLWMIGAPQKLQARWVRIVPHVIDTVLLVSAMALAAVTAQYPFVQPWLTAKVLALPVYILLGTVAIRRGRTRRVRIVAWILALTVFGYMVAVARARVPFPWGI